LSDLTLLSLDSNSLTGSIPTELNNLTKLELLELDSNQLCGEISSELKNLSNIFLPDDCSWGDSCLKLDNNHLTASNSELRAWLNSRNPSWEITQTPCPQQCKLQFSSASYSVTENGGQAIITITRTNNSDGAVSVDYTTSDDSATAGDDYTHTSGTLNWSDGDTNNKTFTVSITDDSIVEGDETLNLTLSNATGGATIGEPAIVTITDNDTTEKHGILQFSKVQFTVKENVHTAQAILTVKRIEGSDGVILVVFATSDDSAKAGSDYSHTTGGVRWEDGDDDDKTFTVHIINDDEPENKETFIVSLANPIGGAQIGLPDTATVTIRDDDFNCKKVSDISKKECKALVALYDSTDGENWTDNTGWKTTNKPCNWNGITCQKKHVTGLDLRNNNLEGSISKKVMKRN
jgi:hypothetical protein